jgi:hypothetical protein
MDKKSSIRFPASSSDNRKSEIENLKWSGIVAIGITFAFGGAVAQAQQWFLEPFLRRVRR